MGYQRPEHLGSHGERRVIGPLSLTNVVGGIAGLVVMWFVVNLLGLPEEFTFSFAALVRYGLPIGGAVMGAMATIRWTGISLLDKAVLWAGYQIRRSMGQTLLKPPAAVRASTTTFIAPITRDGKVIAEVYDPHEEEVHV
jgi:hypothetical protein